MYASYVISDYLQTVRKTLNDFVYLRKDFYDPNLDFDSRMRSYLVRYDSTQVSGGDQDWIGIVWNRNVISDAPELQDRHFQMVQNSVNKQFASLYLTKIAKVSFDIAFFSNSSDYLEDFEEAYYLSFNKNYSNNIILPIFGSTSVAFTELTMGGLTKLDRDDKGTIVELAVSFTSLFPIARPIPGKQNLPTIGEALDPLTGLPTGKPKINLSILFEIC